MRYLISTESDPPESDEESNTKSLFVFRDRPALDEEFDVDAEVKLGTDPEVGPEAEVKLEVATGLISTVSLQPWEGEVKRVL